MKPEFRSRAIPRVVLFTLAMLLAQPAVARAQQAAIDDALPKMVKIFGSGGLRNLEAYSTGFLVSPEGHVATVWNHVLDNPPVTVVLDDGRRFEAEVLGAEPALDLAVLKLQAGDRTLDVPHFDPAEAAEAQPGTRILALSNMYKVAVGDEPVSVLHGVVAAKTRLSARRGAFEETYEQPVYILDAVTNNSGAGGGVVTTLDGRPLGMLGKELRNAESNTWVNYAIPMTALRGVIEEIISGEYVSDDDEDERDESESPERYEPLDFGLVMVPDVLYRTPAYVDDVLDGSAAAEAGLRPNDLVVFVNGKLVQSARELRTELGKLEAGGVLRLVARRGDELVSVQMPVEEKE